MKKHIGISLFFMGCFLSLSATNYFVATNGDDSNAGTLDKPFATLQKAQSKVVPGDTVYIRGGEYRIREEQMMGGDHLRAYVFEMNKSGTQAKRICYTGYQDERPIFNLAEVKPEGKRVSVFYVSGSYLVRGSHNLVLNCDAYNNFDPVSENGTGGNVDGFGGHPASASYTGNVFKGCRAWYNSDDGFDLIKAQAAYTIEDCWAFYNGYKPGGFVGAGDGTGFKAGGYGMRSKVKMPNEIPHHVVKNCLAYKNKNKGFYANHHLGGISWFNNTGYQNPSNFCMLNRKSPGEIVDVDGYDHIIRNNLSYKPRAAGKHIVDVNREECTIINNSFLPVDMTVGEDDFVSLDPAQLTLPRKADGSLPDIDFLKLKRNSKLYDAGIGFQFSAQNL